VISETADMKPPKPQEPVSAVPGYYSCQLSDPELTIRLSFDALDGLLADVMTGFGAIPRRGAEVGGVLLGRVDGREVWIDGFATVECEHRRGPSYLLSDQDRQKFAQVAGQHRNPDRYPVGLFRSNTRDLNTVTDEDRNLFTAYFPPPAGVFLLVRPYATKTSTGSFLAPRNGVLPDETADLFPFSRRELEGGAPPKRRPLNEHRPNGNVAEDLEPAAVPPALEERNAEIGEELEQDAVPPEPAMPSPPADTAPPPVDSPPPPVAPARPPVAVEPEDAPAAPAAEVLVPEDRDDDTSFEYVPAQPYERPRRGWIWIPLSFIFLLLGVLLGFQSAISFYPRPGTMDAGAYDLGLSATGKEDSLHIRWNREAPAIKSAERGRLEIADGTYNKTVDLDASSLQTGSVVYPPLSANVRLRFQVTIKENTVLVQTLDWASDGSR
jgi:hypothetical protein